MYNLTDSKLNRTVDWSAWLLEFYVLAISGKVPTCDSAHSWRLYRAAPLGYQARQHHDLISHYVTLF